MTQKKSGESRKAYRVNEILTARELRYCYAMLTEDDDPRSEKLREELGRAVDRLNDDEMKEILKTKK